MSIVFSEKTRRTRLALRWPFSRQITLSVGTLLVLLAVWWAVAALQWVSPLFLP
ncbi:taurine transporter subunit, partial [Escherichia coli]|nr:taurine transporter subunit [Escherichia coli]